MGQYEPNDSRNVTLNPNSAPGEPPRTGPRESETRAQEEKQRTPWPTSSPQQQQRQSGQSQSQGSRTRSEALPEEPRTEEPSTASDRAVPLTDKSDSPPVASGGKPAAPASGPTAPPPQGDRHEVNEPQSMPPRDKADATRREQASGQTERGFGYGADGEEMADAPEIEEEAEERGYGGGAEERLERNKD